MTKTLLLAQPLKLDDINIRIMDDNEEQEEKEREKQQQYTTNNTNSNIIDDAELLAILGLSTPLNSNSLLDWDDMPELSESEEDEDPHNNKRKYDDEQEDIFAQFDFVEANLLYTTTNNNKKTKIEFSDSTNTTDNEFNLNL